MPEKFKETINLPIAIPAWSLVVFLAGAIFWGGYYGGGMLTKMELMVELLKDTKQKAESTQTQVDRINERQIRGLAQIADHDAELRDHEKRLTAMEERRK